MYVCIYIYKLGFLELKQVSMTFLSERHFLTPSEHSLAFLTNQSCHLFQVYQKRRTEHLIRHETLNVRFKDIWRNYPLCSEKGKKIDCHLVTFPCFHTVDRTASAQTQSKLYISCITGDHVVNCFCHIFSTQGSIKGNYFNHGLGNQSFTIKPWKEGQVIFSPSYLAAISQSQNM